MLWMLVFERFRPLSGHLSSKLRGCNGFDRAVKVSVPYRGIYLLNWIYSDPLALIRHCFRPLSGYLSSKIEKNKWIFWMYCSFRPLSGYLSSEFSPPHPAICAYSRHRLRGKMIFCQKRSQFTWENALKALIFLMRGKIQTASIFSTRHTPICNSFPWYLVHLMICGDAPYCLSRLCLCSLGTLVFSNTRWVRSIPSCFSYIG